LTDQIVARYKKLGFEDGVFVEVSV